jgi:sugar lactone lactonase YvrE
MNIRHLGTLFSFYLLASSSLSVAANSLEPAWETKQLQAPESVIYDKRTNLLFVSNVNGAPNEKNGKGFISTLALDGSVVQLHWVDGLHAPKGLAIVGNILYVADIDQLLEVDINSGKVIKRHLAPQAQFLNDVAADNQGNVYVSDMLTNTLYKLAAGDFSVWLQSEALEYPNGLHIQGDELIVGSWGVMVDGFKTDVAGHLKAVSLRTKTIKSLGNGTSVGNLDGVEADGQGNFYVTDWFNGGLFKIDTQGNAEKLLTLAQGSADLDVVLSEKLLLIPMMLDNTLVAFKIK